MMDGSHLSEAHAATPAWATLFVGREQEITRATRLLATDARVISLVGIGGIGKTRLAIEIVNRLGDRLRVVFVAFAAVRDPSLMLPTIAETIGVAPHEDGPLAGILARLGDERTLLVLDNLER